MVHCSNQQLAPALIPATISPTQNRDAGLVGLAKDAVQLPLAPQRQQAAGIAPTHVEEVFVEHETFQIGRGQAEERQVRCLQSSES